MVIFKRPLAILALGLTATALVITGLASPSYA